MDTVGGGTHTCGPGTAGPSAAQTSRGSHPPYGPRLPRGAPPQAAVAPLRCPAHGPDITVHDARALAGRNHGRRRKTGISHRAASLPLHTETSVDILRHRRTTRLKAFALLRQLRPQLFHHPLGISLPTPPGRRERESSERGATRSVTFGSAVSGSRGASGPSGLTPGGQSPVGLAAEAEHRSESALLAPTCPASPGVRSQAGCGSAEGG